jgi:serine/threonine protein kinase
MGTVVLYMQTICQSKDKWSYMSVSFIATSRGTARISTCYMLMAGNAVNIIKVLGEGGFSFVYLAQDEHSGVSAYSQGSCFRRC